MRDRVAFLMGVLLACVVRVLAWTWRVRVLVPEGLFERREPLVFAFWHGQQLALLAARRRRPALVLVSRSQDGAIQNGAMRALGFRVVRGSSSRGGASAARAIVRELCRGELDAVFAADGPRGPRHRAKPGAARAALLCRGTLVPLASAASRSWVVRRAWDRFEIPRPFSEVVIVAGSPIDPRRQSLLSEAIDAAERAAREELALGVRHPEAA